MGLLTLTVVDILVIIGVCVLVHTVLESFEHTRQRRLAKADIDRQIAREKSWVAGNPQND